MGKWRHFWWTVELEKLQKGEPGYKEGTRWAMICHGDGDQRLIGGQAALDEIDNRNGELVAVVAKSGGASISGGGGGTQGYSVIWRVSR